MNKFYKLKQAIFPVILLAGSCAFAQVQLNQLTDFGTPVKDINNSGKGLHANGYYDFSTNSSSVTEEGVGETVSITNSGMVLGKIADESGENYIPAMRVDGTWNAFTNMDETLGYTLYAISENGVYAVGQTDWSEESGVWGFIYNTQTQTLTILDSPLYEYGAAYGVNNEGIAVGWVDDLPSGTVRMPAYFTEDGTITLIKDTHGEASNINDNNEIVGNFGGAPFIYKIASDEFTSYEIPADYLSAAFADISDNGIAVGYGETFIEGQGPLRMPIIFHPNLGAQPIFLNDFLNEHDIDTSMLDGIGYKISSDGNYLGGWSSGPAFMALGWAVYFDDQIISEPADGCLDAENGQYPSTTFVPACNGAPQGTTGDLAWTGEYTMVQVTNGTEYIFSLSDPTYFITIGDESGATVLTSGTGSVTWTSNLDGNVRFYAHFDSDCNFDSETFLERYVQCGEVPPPPSDCEDFVVLSNNLENGLFFGGETLQHLATDIPVGDTGFTIYGMEPTVIDVATSFEFIIYDDASGLPGTQLETRTGTIVGEEVTGNNFGFDFIKYTVAFDTPLALNANTTYWIEVISDAGGWESTSVSALGNGDVFYNTNTADVWTSTGGDEYVFNLICSELGVSDMNAFDFTYYPNPVKDVLNISSKKNVQNVSVFNLAGQQVINKTSLTNGQIDVTSLAPGVYVFRATLDGGQVETFKIVKK